MAKANCLISKCSNLCKPKHSMCQAHWRCVPRHLKDAVWSAEACYRKRSVYLNWARLHAACKAAIECVARSADRRVGRRNPPP